MSDTIERLSRALEGRYRLVREVGAGGMATVYLAEDLRHHREVALKVLRPELAATMGPERFFREIQLAARLQHPHILPLHDSGEAEGAVFFVMPYVAGESLRTRLDRVGELPIADALRILIQIADALSYSHAQGVVHRDIKPDNVMLSGRHALVTDFGVAKAVGDAAGESTATTAGIALGTPAYMAPEQAVADPQLDQRVDIYAFGVLAYEILTGRTPFHGLSPAQMLAAHVTEPPAPVRKWRDACPAELEAVVMRCLAKRAADRFQSADELLQQLEPLAGSSGGITPSQSRPTARTQAVRAVRAPKLALGGAFVAITVALLIVMLGNRSDSAPPIFERVRLTSSGAALSPALSPDGTRLALSERTCDDAGLCTSDIRIQDIAGAGSTVLAAGLQGVGAIDWSEDGRWLLFSGSVRQRYGVYALLAIGGEPRFLGCCAGTLGPGDTILLTDGSGAPRGRQIVRRLLIADARVVDSIELTGWTRPAYEVWAVPGSNRLLATVVDDGPTGLLYLAGRDAQVLDSLRVENFFPFVAPLRTLRDGFIVPTATEAGESVTFLRYRLDGTDRFDDEPQTLARGIGAQFGAHVTRDGTMLVADGPVEWALMLLERTTLQEAQFTRRELARSTANLTGGITPPGDQLFVVRMRPNEPRVRELSIVPFSGGAARSLGTMSDLVDWDPSGDGLLVLTVQRLEDDRLLVSELTVMNGRSRPLDTLAAGHESLEAIPGGGYLIVRAPRELALKRRPGQRDTIIALPPGPDAPQLVIPSPDGRQIAVVGWAENADSIEVHRGPITGGEFRSLGMLSSEGATGLSWLPDGSILLSALETRWTPAWYRFPPDGGPARRVDIGLGGDASYRLSLDGLRSIGRERTQRPDIFLLKAVQAP